MTITIVRLGAGPGIVYIMGDPLVAIFKMRIVDKAGLAARRS